MTLGIDDETLDGIDMVWFSETHKNLRRESWFPKPARRVYIPKSNGKMRPLGISSPRDKIIQQAMKLTIEVVLEPKFLDCSHGFRPSRGCHTALREVRKWKGVSWFVEGDIKNFFNNIDHQTLEKLLKVHFKEARFINLFWKFVKAGYIDWDKDKVNWINSEVGVPQGGIISPILSNLILDELDRYITGIKAEYDKKKYIGLKPYMGNPEYNKYTMPRARVASWVASLRINRLKRKISKLKSEKQEYITEKRQLIESIRIRRRLSSLLPNPLFTRIEYVRYADYWLIGIWGDKNTAKELKEKIAEKLKELKLELSLEKTLITNARSKRANFLGTFIKRLASTSHTMFQKLSKGRKRIPTGNLWMSAPILEIVDKLDNKEFMINRKPRWTPRSIPKFLPLPVGDIAMRFNSIVTGITNYYSFADNRRRLNKIIWILKESMRKTICRKLKIGKRTFYRRFGEEVIVKNYDKLKDKVRITKFAQPDLTRNPMHFLCKTEVGGKPPIRGLTIQDIS